MARVRQVVRQFAVVRQQQRARRVCVEAADGDDARGMRDELDDVRPTLRVARRRDDTRGLVQEDVGQALLRQRAAVELDAVARLHEGVQLPALAVDGDAACLDQLVGAATRRHPGACQPRVQAHRTLRRVA